METEERACANGGGMKRRQLLTRALLGTAFMGVPVAVAEASARPAMPAENPNLIALGAELPNIEQAYLGAVKKWSAAWTEWAPQWPLAPEACCQKFHGHEMERDLTGMGLTRDGETAPWYVKTAAQMECDIDTAREALAKDDKRKRSYGKRFRQYRHDEIAQAELGLALLPGYLAERERVKRESGFDAIDKERYRASDAVFEFARRVLEEHSLTAEGVRIKVQACAALGRMHPYDRSWGRMRDSIGNRPCMASVLAEAMLEAMDA